MCEIRYSLCNRMKYTLFLDQSDGFHRETAGYPRQLCLYLQALCDLGLDRELLTLGVVNPDEILLGLGAQPAKFRLRHRHTVRVRGRRRRRRCARDRRTPSSTSRVDASRIPPKAACVARASSYRAARVVRDPGDNADPGRSGHVMSTLVQRRCRGRGRAGDGRTTCCSAARSHDRTNHSTITHLVPGSSG